MSKVSPKWLRYLRWGVMLVPIVVLLLVGLAIECSLWLMDKLEEVLYSFSSKLDDVPRKIRGWVWLGEWRNITHKDRELFEKSGVLKK